MTKPKVLFILHLPPPMHGAAMAGSYIKQSDVVNEEFDTQYIDLATNRTLNESGKGSLKKVIAFAKIVGKVLKAVSRNKYDLCYMTFTATGAAFYKDMIIVFIVKTWNKKIIYHFHNKGISAVKNKFTTMLYRYVFRGTKSILASRYLYYDIEKYVSEKDVFYCLFGIPPTIKNEDTQTETLPKGSGALCQLLFLSNMIREKGIFVLLNACEILKEKGIPFECHFVGGWSNIPEEEFRKKIKEKELSDVVFAHGPKYNTEKMAFYKRADVFVFPTYYDTFGLVNLEAMQNGLPIVSTPEGGIRDIIIDGETGFLVPQQNAAALAEKLTLLINDPLLRYKMGQAGKKRFYEEFTIDKFERRMSSILEETIYQN